MCMEKFLLFTFLFSPLSLNILKSEPFKPHLCSKLVKSTRTINGGKIKVIFHFNNSKEKRSHTVVLF